MEKRKLIDPDWKDIQTENKELKHIVNTVVLMREAQRNFFRTRKKLFLKQSKNYEGRVDALVDKWVVPTQKEINF